MKLGSVCGLMGLLIASLAPCSAQEREARRILAGPTVGFGPIIERSDLPVFANSPQCGVFQRGEAWGTALGGTLTIPSLFTNRFGLTAALGATLASGSFRADPIDPVRIFDRDNENLVELEREYRLYGKVFGASLDLLGRYHITDQLSIALGGTFSWQFSATYTETDNVLGPGDYAFDDGQREHPMVEGGAITPARFLAGPTLRVAYELPLRFGALLVPELSMHTDLSSAVNEGSWRSYQMGGRISLLFDVAPRPAAAAPPVVVEPQRPDPPIEPVVVVARQNPRLAASITLYGVDENNRPLAVTKVHVNEVLYRQYAPLLPTIFFDRDSAAIPERYAPLAGEPADSFSLDLLAGLEVLDVQRYALDITGLRMRDNPAARITLIGSASKDEPTTLARARAERARSYLETRWGIQRSRMAVQEGGGAMQRSNEMTEDGRADNRRVEIVSSDDGIFRHVETEQIVRDFDPPIIKLSPSYDAEAGMKSWRLKITQGENIVASYSNGDEGALEAPELTWHLAAEEIDSALDPLVAELTVEDSTGATVTARNQVALSLERRLTVVDGRVARNGDREQISYNLVGFDYNSSDPGRLNESIVREIAALARKGARVTVIGYTDRIGEAQHNVELSMQRATRVASLLRARLEARGLRDIPISATGAGIETARFPNDLPEGRVLSRGVSVLVEQTYDAPGH